jgi:RNA polymerase sigma-70 factor (ECF subfamily)
MLTRAAVHELARRRSQLHSVSGPEFDDLVHQAADDALVNVLARLDDFRGLSRFSTWAYGFVSFELAAKVARHAWHRQPPGLAEQDVEMIGVRRPSSPSEQLERRAQLRALAQAIGQLTPRQRDVLTAVALNDVSIDDIALRLGSNRNAVYKNLFDARRALRRRLAGAGLPISDEPASEPTSSAPRYVAQRKPTESGRGASGLAGSSLVGSSSL